MDTPGNLHMTEEVLDCWKQNLVHMFKEGKG